MNDSISGSDVASNHSDSIHAKRHLTGQNNKRHRWSLRHVLRCVQFINTIETVINSTCIQNGPMCGTLFGTPDNFYQIVTNFQTFFHCQKQENISNNNMT